MAIILPTLENGRTGGDAETTAHTRWAAFIHQRNDLTNRMELETCDGCDGCGLRCMDGFGVSQSEWEAVQVYLKSLPADDVARVRNQEKTVPWPGAEESGATVTFCPFRDMENGNCFVYPVRPTVCRLFGHTHWLPCPIEAVGYVPGDGGDVWSAYQKFDRRPWADWEKEGVQAGESEISETPNTSGTGGSEGLAFTSRIML